MFIALKGITCFVTVTVCLVYATRIAWVCGKKCNFKVDPECRRQTILESFPAATALYFIGFLITLTLSIDGFVMIVVSAMTSAILVSSMVLTMAMPELKRRPRPQTKWPVSPKRKVAEAESDAELDLSLNPRRS